MTDHAPPPASLSDAIRRQARALGFEAVGITSLRPSDHAALYRAWIERGLHGSMDYLAREDAVAARLDPRSRWPELVSAVVVAHHYGDVGDPRTAPPSDEGDTGGPGPATGIIARYARGRDYHRVVKKKLLALLRWIEAETGRELPRARAYVDSGPVLERELAQRAGLGWQGRNTMLIDPRRGSYFFLGSLLLPFELDYDDAFTADRCGTCRACIPACPTDALLGRDEDGAPIMDARLCISYLTIENQGPIPEELRPLMGNRVFGCDICQEACPYVQRFTNEASEPNYEAREAGKPPHGVEPVAPEPGGPGGQATHPGTEFPSLIELLRTALDPEAWNAFSRGSAIRRAGRSGFARNVAVALGNLASESAVPVLVAALSDSSPLVRGHAAWALGEVASPEAAEALAECAGSESDPWVSGDSR